jgi:hypothetical protein
MSKFLLNLLLQISKSLVNLKIQFFNLVILFLAFGPADPAACSASDPANPTAALSPQAEIIPVGPSSPRVSRVLTENTFSLSDHAFPSRPPLPRLSVNRAPPIRFTPFPAPAGPGQKSPAPLSRASDAPELLQPPSSLSPLNPLQTEP